MICAKSLPGNFKFCSYNGEDVAVGDRQLLIKTTHKGDLFTGDISGRDSVRADGLVSDGRGLSASMFTADCAPLVLIDKVSGAWAFIHVNWYGAISGQAGRTAEEMVNKFETKPENIVGVIGPTICADCYVQRGWRGLMKRMICYLSGQSKLVKKVSEGVGLDLRLGITSSLAEAGVKINQIEDLNICTCHDYWPSHLREGKGRQKSLHSVLDVK